MKLVSDIQLNKQVSLKLHVSARVWLKSFPQPKDKFFSEKIKIIEYPHTDPQLVISVLSTQMHGGASVTCDSADLGLVMRKYIFFFKHLVLLTFRGLDIKEARIDELKRTPLKPHL